NHFDRIATADAHPEDIHLEIDRALVPTVEKNVDRPGATLTLELEAVIVVAELHSGGPGLHAGFVHLVRDLLEVVRTPALFGEDVRHHHVFDAELFSVFDGLRPGASLGGEGLLLLSAAGDPGLPVPRDERCLEMARYRFQAVLLEQGGELEKGLVVGFHFAVAYFGD